MVNGKSAAIRIDCCTASAHVIAYVLYAHQLSAHPKGVRSVRTASSRRLCTSVRGFCVSAIIAGMGIKIAIIGIGIMVESAVPFPYQPIVGLVVFAVGAVMSLLGY